MDAMTSRPDGNAVPDVTLPEGAPTAAEAAPGTEAAVALAELLPADGVETLLTSQREYLRDLGVSGTRPDLALASSDPMAYLRGLSRASAAAELTDPSGLGAFGWLMAFSSC